MKRRYTDFRSPWHVVSFAIAAALVLAAVLPGVVVLAADSAGVKARLADPPREYSSGAAVGLERHAHRGADREHAGATWPARRSSRSSSIRGPGLMTPYLSDDWFRLWKVALDEAERLDMNVWIYDENSYPSGFAGGLVPEAMPESRGKGLALRAK